MAWNCTVGFERGNAHSLTGVGSIYGKPIWVTYDYYDPAHPGDPGRAVHVENELHIVPDVLRYQYQPYWVRLGHPFVNPDTVTVSLPNGRGIAAVGWGDDPVDGATLTAPLPAGWTHVLPRGLLDTRWMRIDTVTGVFPLQQGSPASATHS